MDETPEDRSSQVRGALLKGLALVVVVAVLIAVGTTVLVHALGLSDDGQDAVGGGSGAPTPASPLPSTALPVPSDSASPSDLPSPSKPPKGRIQLTVSPVLAKPMERVNLTGVYPGQDNLGLQVQRLENGQWSDFGVGAPVRVGTFATYVMTGRVGDNKFRVFDPQADKGSNVVTVTID